MTRLRLDSVDLFQYTRVSPGEGLEPSSTDFVSPTFGDSVGEGAPLSALTLNNTEPQIPMHIIARDAIDATEVVNDIPNPRFALGVNGWTIGGTATNVALTRSTSWAAVGSNWDSRAASGRLVSDASSTQTATLTSDALTCLPGDRISVAAYFKALGLAYGGTKPTAVVTLNFYTNLMGLISSVDGTVLTLNADGINKLSADNIQAPATASFYTVTVKLTCGTTSWVGGQFFLGAIIAARGTATIKLYHDGDSPGWTWDGVPFASSSRGPAVPWVNLLLNPRGSGTIDGWDATYGLDSITAATIVEDNTSPTGTCIKIGYDTSADPYMINEGYAAASLPGNHILSGDWVTFGALMKANAAAHAGLAATSKFANISINLGGVDQSATVDRNNTDWQWVSISRSAASFYAMIRGRGASVADADVRFTGMILGRGSTQAESEAQAKNLAFNSFFDGDSLDGEYGSNNRLSCRYVGKDGLHKIQQKLDLLCTNAQQYEWRDADASRSTFRDVLAARFEHEYNYRRAQRKWVSGVLHLWTRPVGHTGTFRNGPTAAGTRMALATGLLSKGDRPADLKAVIAAGSGPAYPGRIVGVFTAKPDRVVQWPAASLSVSFTNTIGVALKGTGASPAATAYQQLLQWGRGSITDDVELCRLIYTGASTIQGRSRVLVEAQAGDTPELLYALDRQGNRLGPGGVPSHFAGYGMVDLGILDVQPGQNLTDAEVIIRSKVAEGYSPYKSFKGATAAIARVLLIPEETLSMVIDTDRRFLGWDNFDTSYNGVDRSGNQYNRFGEAASTVDFTYSANGPGILAASNASGYHRAMVLIGTPTVASLDAALALVHHGIPSTIYELGKSVGTYKDVHAAFHLAATQVGVLSLWSGSSMLASMSIPSVTNQGAYGVGEMSLRVRGNSLQAEYRNPFPSNGSQYQLVGSIAAAAASYADAPGQPYMSMYCPAVFDAFSVITGYRAAEIPSTAIAGRDVYEFSPSGVIRSKASSMIRRLPPIGQTKPVASVGLQNVYAFEIPFADDPNSGILDVAVKVRERFTYAQ